jgi:hypothetical protein
LINNNKGWDFGEFTKNRRTLFLSSFVIYN